MTTNRNIGVSLTADPTQLQAGLRSASSAAQQFAATTNEAFGRASAASARLGQSSKGLADSANQQTLAARAHQAAADRFVRDMERRAAAIGKTRSELLSLQAAELGVERQAAPFIAKIRETEQALGAGAIQFNKYGLSAKQTEAALRGVPAQVTDIVVALQGGQRPLTVLLQQGGQLKDMFGGIAPAAQALGSTVLGMVNPFTLAAGAAVGLYAAYRAGAAESEAFNRTIIMTGGVAGVTADQLTAMAERVGAVAGTQRQAAAALNEMAGSGRIAAQNFEQFAVAAMEWEKATGTAVSDTVKQFEELGKAPVEASLKLNESLNYLTTSTYQQIKALQESGRETEAAALAQKLFADTIDQRSPQILEQVGSIERAWHAVKGAVTGAIDAMMDIGRPETIESLNDRLQGRLKQLAALQDSVRFTETPGGAAIGHRPARNAYAQGVVAQEAQQLAAEIQMLQQQLTAAQIVARQKRELEQEMLRDEYVGGRLTRDQERAKRIQEEQQAFARAVQGLAKDSAEYERIYGAHKTALLNIDKQFEEKRSGGISTTQTELARLNALMEAERQREEALHSVGLAQANLNEGERLAIQYAEKLKLATDEKTKSQLAANKALAEEYGARKRANDVFEKELKDRQSAIDTARKQTLALRDQIETYGMGKSAIEELTIARLEERLAIAEGEPELAKTVEGLREEIAARKELLSAMRTKEGLDAQLKEWQNWEREVDRIFGQLGQSLTDQLFDGGKSARDMIKDLFKALTLRVVVQPVMSSLQGMVTNQLGGLLGYQNPSSSPLGMAQGAYGAYNAATGGLSGSMGTAAARMGQMMGSEALTSFGLGLSGTTAATGIASIGASLGASLGTSIGTSAAAMTTTTFSAAMGGGALIPGLGVGVAGGGVGAGIGAAGAAAGGAAAGGAAGFGAAVGAALPWIGGALAIGSLLGGGLFDREPTTRREQRTQVEYGGGIFDITKTDDRAPAGADAAARALAEQAVATANDIFRQVGVDAAIDSFHAIMASSYQGDRDGVASGGQLRIGDELRQFGIDLNDPNPTIQGFGGWSSAETLPRLATDIQLSVLEAFQSLSDQLPNVLASMLEGIDIRSLGEQEAQALAERFTLLTQGASQFLAAIETMPFEQLRDLSFDAAANMIQLAGGLENLVASQQTYYERFYSDAERHGHAVDQLTQALAGVGVEMPALVGSTDDMLASYRALVESLDLNTEAGQQAYVTLMQTAGAFADVAQFAGQAAVESQRLADQQRQAMQALRQSFVGLAGDALAAIQQHGQERIAKLSESFGRTDAILNAYRTQVQQLESQWGSLIATMQRSMRDLRGQVEEAARLQYNQARAVISTALLTGKPPQTADLGEAIRVAQQGVTGGRYASAFDQREAYLKLANELEALQGIAQPELDTARASLAQLEKQYNRLRGIEDLSGLSLKQLEKQLGIALSAEAAARTQIAQIEQQIALAQLQYQQLVGINDELSTLPGALQALAKAIDAASRVPAESTAVNREARYLANNPDVLAAYVRGDWGVQTAEEAARYHWEKYGRYEGRSFDVGTPYVPYDMKANIHRGEIIIDPRSSDILRRYGIGVQGGGTSRETEQLLREQLAEVRQQNRYLYEIVKSGKRTERNTGDTAMAIAHGGSDDVLLVTY